MSDKLWKQNERETAKRLGGKRVPITGRQRGDQPDIEHGALSIECKHRNVIPNWIKDAIDQAVASIKNPEQVPIVQVHEKGANRDNDLIIMRMIDFQALSWWEGDTNDAAK